MLGAVKKFLPQVGANSSGEWGALYSSIHTVPLLALFQLSNITDKAISFCKALNREKSLRHVAMVTKFLDLNKPWSCKYGRKKRNK